MKCPVCGAENSGGAKVCADCGAKTVCGDCGRELPLNAAFCGWCGARVRSERSDEGKNDGTPTERSESAPSESDAEVADRDAVLKKEKAASAKKNGVRFASRILSLVTVAAALCFVCFLGFTFEFAESETVTIGLKSILTGGFDIFDIIEFSPYEKFVRYFVKIAEIVAWSATAALIVVFSVLAVIGTVREFLGKDGRNYGKFALAAFVSYAVGCGLLGTFFLEGGEDYSIKFNAATVAGLTLCTLFAAAYVCCRIAEKHLDKRIEKKDGVNIGLAVCGAALAVIAIAAVCGIPYVREYLPSGDLFGISVVDHLLSVGVTAAIGVVSAILSFLTFGLMVAALVLGGIVVYKRIFGMLGGSAAEKTEIAFGSVGAAYAAAALITGVIDIFAAEEGYAIYPTENILASALFAAVNIAFVFIARHIARSADRRVAKLNGKRAVYLASETFALLAAFVLLIAVHRIGSSDGRGAFWFLWRGFADGARALEASTLTGTAYELSVITAFLPTALGAAAVSAALIGVGAFGLRALGKASRGIFGEETSGSEKGAAYALAVFIGAAAVIKMFCGGCSTVTNLCMALGAVFAALSSLGKLALSGDKIFSAEKAVRLASAAFIAVVSAIAISVLVAPTYKVTQTLTQGNFSGQGKTLVSRQSFITMITALIGDFYGNRTDMFNSGFLRAGALLSAAAVIAAAICFLAALTIGGVLSSLVKEKRLPVVLTIATVAFGIVLLVLSAAAINTLTAILYVDKIVGNSLIAALVLSLFASGAAIACGPAARLAKKTASAEKMKKKTVKPTDDEE